jgi:hypothetical protein
MSIQSDEIHRKALQRLQLNRSKCIDKVLEANRQASRCPLDFLFGYLFTFIVEHTGWSRTICSHLQIICRSSEINLIASYAVVRSGRGGNMNLG